jgi:hypothetical protein
MICEFCGEITTERSPKGWYYLPIACTSNSVCPECRKLLLEYGGQDQTSMVRGILRAAKEAIEKERRKKCPAF